MSRTIIKNIVIQHYDEAQDFTFCEYTSIRFFEIVYFHTGEGTIKVNDRIVPYKAKSLFVFVPGDIYIVSANQVTTVTTIKFLKSFFYNLNTSHDWFRKIEEILLSNNYLLPEVSFKEEEDMMHLASLVKMLVKEYEKSQSYDIFIIENSLTIILHLIARNIEFLWNSESKFQKHSKIQDIVNFIHLNVYDSSLISSTYLAKKFSVSENYISEYFKRNMGIGLKKYVLNHKLKIVETKLEYSKMHYSEIANELGFTDTSHLNKVFKSYKGVSLSDFRKQLS